MKIHLGHHFFGAGNLGDDFLLAGFLAALAARGRRAELSGCVPQGREGLARRFPAVDWREYGPAGRRSCIEKCDIWLGLGGAPWQSAVSDWFARHLEEEAAACAAAGRPMYFLGVGGQDAAAYAVPALRRAAEQAEGIWTRDEAAAAALARIARPGRVRAAADLAHLFFARRAPPPPGPGRLAAVLNFDFGAWPGLAGALAGLARLPVRERIWLAQETRPLPGAEIRLLQELPEAERARWRLQRADSGGPDLAAVLAGWPSPEWLLSSRFHATLAAAWAGGKAAVLASNEKLRGAAAECGFPLVELSAPPGAAAAALERAEPAPAARLRARARLAEQACAEFFGEIGL